MRQYVLRDAFVRTCEVGVCVCVCPRARARVSVRALVLLHKLGAQEAHAVGSSGLEDQIFLRSLPVCIAEQVCRSCQMDGF